MDEVEILYRRPPDRLERFRQAVVHDGGDHVVTLLAAAALRAPLTIGGRVALEPGSPIVWFTYRGDVWHDVGRFHTADGRFTGLYANVLTPVRMDGPAWETTDLFLDVWLPPGGVPEILDRDELERAVESGVLSPRLADRAGREADALLAAAATGRWPPAHVHEWTLERARNIFRPPPRTTPSSEMPR